MSKPMFLLTNKVTIDIIRRESDRYEYGNLVPGAETSIPVEVNIQPLKPSEILMLPESDRTREWYKLYSAEQLRTMQEGAAGWSADEFMLDGYRYKIMKVRKYQMGVLDHFKALAARIEITPN